MFMTNESHSNAIESFMYKVYGWMFIGLLTTAISGFLLFTQPILFNLILGSYYHLIALFAIQMGLIFYLHANLQTMSYTHAGILFLLYSVLTGFSLAPLYLIYTMNSIVQTLIITAGMFGSMAIYGFWTKTDLSHYGTIFQMGLLGLIIALVVNMFVGSSLFDYYLSFLGVALFTGLTAYDVQKIKVLGAQWGLEDDQMSNKIALFGAITLYLDFINLFLYLLKLMGKRRK